MAKAETKAEPKKEVLEKAKQAQQDADMVWIKGLATLLCVLVFVGMPLGIAVASSSEPSFEAARAFFNCHAINC